MDEQLQHRFTVLTWAVGLAVALSIATLGMLVTLSFQVGQTNGELAALIGHVTLH